MSEPRDKFELAHDRLSKALVDAQDHSLRLKGACVDCKYFSSSGQNSAKDWECRNPLVSAPELDPMTGNLDPGYFIMGRWYKNLDDLEIPRLCGYNRDIFMPKPPKLNWLQRLFRVG